MNNVSLCDQQLLPHYIMLLYYIYIAIKQTFISFFLPQEEDSSALRQAVQGRAVRR